MCIYCNTANYRKIYENHYGPIPKDEIGRSYEIHHIDGNHSNNDPTNLKCVSMQEHYDIHYSQGDHYACLRIAEKLKLSNEEISNLATMNNLKRVKNGTHPFVGGDIQKRRVADGTHNFLGGDIQRQTNINQWKKLGNEHPLAKSTKDRIEKGTHNWQGGENQRIVQNKLVNTGQHHFLNKEWRANEVKRRIDTNTHNFQGPNSPTQVTWECPHCGKIGKGRSNYNKNHGDRCKLL